MQQINLYQTEFRPNREPLRSIHMLWGLVGLLLILALVSAYQQHTSTMLQAQIALERAQLENTQAEMAELLKFSPQTDLAQLDAQIAELTQERARREQIYEVISNKNLGNNTGFSAFLQALGHQSLTTLSLNAFSLQKGGNYVELVGVTRAADQVPYYIQRLRTEAVFAEVGFGVLNVTPLNSNKTLYQFSLAEMLDRQSVQLEHKTLVQSLLEQQQAGAH